MQRAATKSCVCFLAALCLMAACRKSESPAPGAGQAAGQAPGSGPGAVAEPAGNAAAQTDLTLQLNWVPEPEFGGFYAALHGGLYAQAGLKVDIAAGSAGIQTWKMVATGKVPFAIASAGDVIRARLQDADVVAVFAVYQTNPQALMVHEEAGISSLEEIFSSGKIERVAMEAGLSYARHLEQRYDLSKVSLVQYSGNLSLFLQDPKMAQQCFIFSEPVSAKEKGVAVEAFSIAESGFNPYLALVITSQAFLAKDPEAVARFVRASRAGWQAYLDDPGPTNQHMTALNPNMTIAAMNTAAALQAPYVVGGPDQGQAPALGSMSEDRWRALAGQLHGLGEIERVPDDIAGLFRNIE